QMKMFLTRIGFGSRAVVTGDLTQTDLPAGRMSGLRHALDVLPSVTGVSISFFDASDVVRHPLVQRIVRRFEQRGRITNRGPRAPMSKAAPYETAHAADRGMPRAAAHAGALGAPDGPLGSDGAGATRRGT